MKRAAVCLAALGACAHAQNAVVHVGTLHAVPGEPAIHDATIVIENGSVREVLRGYRDAGALFDAGIESVVVDLKDRFVVPGLIDCHTHITHQSVARDEAMRRTLTETEPYAAIDGVVYAHRTLMAGFTTVRNVGSSGTTALALRDRINQGVIDGPRMFVAGPSVAVTGGHADRTNALSPDLRPSDIPPEFAPADGPGEVRKAVRARVRMGVDLIKITATGGVLSLTAAGLNQQFMDDELASIVEASHMMGRKVAAHAHGADGIKAALRAGVDSIEHGTYLDDEAIALFVEHGAYLVPTIHAGKFVEARAKEDGYYIPAVRRKAAEVGPLIQGAFGRAYKAGVKIAFGTDCGVGDHGTNALEFVYMHEAGMTPEDCLIAATVHAADLIGVSDRLGTIEPGKWADMVAFDADPMTDITAYQRPTFVMKQGKVYRDTLRD